MAADSLALGSVLDTVTRTVPPEISVPLSRIPVQAKE